MIQTADPTGALDTVRLRDALHAVAGRHDVLRITYCVETDGEPRPTVHDDLTPGWSTHDLSELSDHARRLRLEVLAQREFSAEFDLRFPMHRFAYP
ncbi:MAG: mycobactin peptide synthetase MbtE, partial [Mycobacterium sp.]|nr:mycobactin peptide synthetase MbtE [Mycobacterium sp.]